MYELNILKSFLSRNNYLEYRNYVKDTELTKEVIPVFKTLDLWYKQNNKDCSLDDLCNLFFSQGVQERELYQKLFSSLGDSPPPESVKTLLEGFKRQRALEDISAAAYEASIGKKPLDKVLKLAESLSSPIKDDIPFVTDDLSEIIEDTVKTPGLKWRLNTLNRMLGSLRKGDFGFIFARPEVGKTTFLASEVTHMASQLGQDDGPILWFNLEEEGKKVKFRCFQAALGIDKAEILHNPKKAQEEYLKLTNGKILMYDDAGTSKYMIEKACEKYKPSLVVVDQLDKVHGFQNDREDLRLGQIYIWARELAKRHCAVIGVCQADGTAEGQEFLTMAEVSNSKTSKAAEADWILGIGRKDDAGYENLRGLSTPKNKLLGDDETDPNLRHGKQRVLIKPSIQRYIDIE